MAPGDSKGLFVYRTREYPQLEPDVAPFAQFAPILGHIGDCGVARLTNLGPDRRSMHATQRLEE
jgi:hypothetical protein